MCKVNDCTSLSIFLNPTSSPRVPRTQCPYPRVLRNVPIGLLYLYFRSIPASQFMAWLGYMLTYITINYTYFLVIGFISNYMCYCLWSGSYSCLNRIVLSTYSAKSLQHPLRTQNSSCGGHAIPSMSPRSRGLSLMLLHLVHSQRMFRSLRPPQRAATSRVLGQSQPVQSFLECPVARDHLCDVMCCHEPPSSQSGTDIRKEGECIGQ